MYGLVNKALEDMVCNAHGEEVWEAIKRKAGVDIEAFISMEAYDDRVTYNLVGAASAVLGKPADDLLRAFGRYWILYTAKEGYGDMLKMCGGDFLTFVRNLDQLHARVGLSFQHLTPPSFRCTDLSERSLRLHYYTGRDGLVPMVIGILEGLGQMFNNIVEVEQVAFRAQGADHEELLVQFRPA